ncbi:MAG TPA: ATP/GTP-binding protein, partial [Puia sp.]|nr:ATP/GTP-binding protein [Puia sp.]
MKRLILSVIVILAYSRSFAQHSLEKLWESDSVTLRNPESALFDPKSNSLYVSSTGSGSVTRMD